MVDYRDCTADCHLDIVAVVANNQVADLDSNFQFVVIHIRLMNFDKLDLNNHSNHNTENVLVVNLQCTVVVDLRVQLLTPHQSAVGNSLKMLQRIQQLLDSQIPMDLVG